MSHAQLLHSLYLAAYNPQATSLVSWLQDLLECRDARGCTPLHLAAQQGNASVVAWLMHHRANAVARDHSDATPLHYAAVCPQHASRTRMMSLILIDSASVKMYVNASDVNGHTALHWAAGVCHTPADLEGLLICVAKANINAEDKLGNTPLHHAAASSTCPDIVDFLIHQGAKADACNVYGDTVVHTAIGFGNPSSKMLKALMSSFSSATGASALAAVNKAGHTPLQLAVIVGWSTSAVRVLLEMQQRQQNTCTSLLDLMVSCGWRLEIADSVLLQALADGAIEQDIWKALCLLSQKWVDSDAMEAEPSSALSEAGHFRPRLQVRFNGLVTPSNSRLRHRLVARLSAVAVARGQGGFTRALNLACRHKFVQMHIRIQDCMGKICAGESFARQTVCMLYRVNRTGHDLLTRQQSPPTLSYSAQAYHIDHMHIVCHTAVILI